MNPNFFTDILADHDITATSPIPDSQLPEDVQPELDVQPKNEVEPEPFVVGANIDSFGDRTALPRPKYPNPGQPRTPEIFMAHFMEDLLWSQATRALRDCIRWTKIRLTQPAQWTDPYSGPPKDLYAEACS